MFCFHLASLADIVPSIQNPKKYFESNVNGTLNILEGLQKSKNNKIYLFSIIFLLWNTKNLSNK